jgi:hypothetical protein
MTKYLSSGRWRPAALIGAIFAVLGPCAAARELNAPSGSVAPVSTLFTLMPKDAPVLPFDMAKGTPRPSLSAESAAEPKTEQDSVSLRVLWTVSGHVRGPNARVDDEQARSLIFSPMDMTDESISFAGQVCKPITFSRKTLALRDYLWARHGIAPQHLNLEDQSAQVIKTTCELPGFGEFLRLEDSRLIVSINGIFYFLDPVVSY